MARCSDCERWYRLGGSVKGQCLRMHKRVTMYNDECCNFGVGVEEVKA